MKPGISRGAQGSVQPTGNPFIRSSETHDKPVKKGTLLDKREQFFIADPSARPCCRSMNSPIDPPIARSRTRVVVDSNAASCARLRAVCDRAGAQDGALLMSLRSPQNVSPFAGRARRMFRPGACARVPARARGSSRAHLPGAPPRAERPVRRTCEPRLVRDAIGSSAWHRHTGRGLAPVRTGSRPSFALELGECRLDTCRVHVVRRHARPARAGATSFSSPSDIHSSSRKNEGARAGETARRARPMHHEQRGQEEAAQRPAQVPR